MLLVCTGVLVSVCVANRKEEKEEERDFWPETRKEGEVDSKMGESIAPLLRKSMSTLIERERLDLKEIIGKGSFGNVYRADWDGDLVAVKTFESTFPFFFCSHLKIQKECFSRKRANPK